MPTITYQNPVYGEYFADPFVWRAQGRFFAVGTGAADAAGEVRTGAFDVLTSTDLVSWKRVGRALVPPDRGHGDTFWAPEVMEHDGVYYLYYSVGHEDRQHQLRVAVAKEPSGPYEDVAGLTSLDDCAFAIDAHPFRDVDGGTYLFHARDFLDDDGGRARPGTALVVQELSGMTRLVGEPKTVLRARSDWQRYERDRLMYGRTFDWHTLEGPCVVRSGDLYYCMFSGGAWKSAGYGVDYGVARSVLGPYDDRGNEEGARVLRTVPGRVVGPGHHSVVLGPDDRTSFICYHAWDADMTARRLCIDPLVMTPDGPRCDGPSWTVKTLR